MAERDKMNDLITRAVIFAAEKHADQKRKGTDIPYIFHPLEVMRLLLDMNAHPELIAAGVLHDTLEDTDTTYEELVREFGEEVADYVSCLSEDKSKAWDERKAQAIEEADRAGIDLKHLIFADKYANLKSIYEDYRVNGDEVFRRFNAGKEDQAWYYSGMLSALADLADDPAAQELYAHANQMYNEIFCRFYYSDSEKALFFENEQHEIIGRTAENGEWEEYIHLPEDAEEISAEEANYIRMTMDFLDEGITEEPEEDIVLS